MVLKCAAKGCNSKHDGSFEQSFFKFPKHDLKLRQQWLDLLGIPDFVPKPTSAVCWKHFHPSSMKIRGRPNKDNKVRPRRRLVINAVPDFQGSNETSIWPEEESFSTAVFDDMDETFETGESGIFLPTDTEKGRPSVGKFHESLPPIETNEQANEENDEDVQSFPDHAYAKLESVPKHVSWLHACSKDDQIVELRRKVKRLQDCLRNGERRIRMLQSDPTSENCSDVCCDKQ